MLDGLLERVLSGKTPNERVTLLKWIARNQNSGQEQGAMSTFVLNRLNEYLTEQFHQVHHLLRLMGGIPGIQDELTKVGELVDFGRIEGEAQKRLKENVSSEHTPSGFSDYADKIEYSSDDMELETGFLRIWGKRLFVTTLMALKPISKSGRTPSELTICIGMRWIGLCRNCCQLSTAAECGSI